MLDDPVPKKLGVVDNYRMANVDRIVVDDED